jgi:hypothetical protein
MQRGVVVYPGAAFGLKGAEWGVSCCCRAPELGDGDEEENEELRVRLR